MKYLHNYKRCFDSGRQRRGTGRFDLREKIIQPNVYKLQSPDQIIQDIRCVRSNVPPASDSDYHTIARVVVEVDAHGFPQDALEADVPCNGSPSAVEEEEDGRVFFVRGGPEVETKRWQAFAGTSRRGGTFPMGCCWSGGPCLRGIGEFARMVKEWTMALGTR